MKSSVRWDDVQSGTGWKNEIKCSLGLGLRSKFNLGQGERMKSSYCWGEAEDQNSIWDRVKEWNQVFAETKLKIKIQSGTGWKNGIKCSLRRSRRSKFNLEHIERMKSSVRNDKAEDQNSI